MPPSRKTQEIEILPAILVKSREELLEQIDIVKPFVKNVHIDMMDGLFVPNETLSVEELKPLPYGLGYTFHWMVEKPEEYIPKIPGTHMHIVHIETVKSWEKIEAAAKKSGGRLGLSMNPDTPVEDVLGYKGKVSRFLVMSVIPGFDGQKYIEEVEPKIAHLREACPDIEIEVDGGINFDTAPRAVKAGASMLASASTIFRAESPGEAIRLLKNYAEGALR